MEILCFLQYFKIYFKTLVSDPLSVNIFSIDLGWNSNNYYIVVWINIETIILSNKCENVNYILTQSLFTQNTKTCAFKMCNMFKTSN